MTRHTDMPWEICYKNDDFPTAGGVLRNPSDHVIAAVSYVEHGAMEHVIEAVNANAALLTACRSMRNAWEDYLKDPDNIGADIEGMIGDADEAIAAAWVEGPKDNLQ